MLEMLETRCSNIGDSETFGQPYTEFRGGVILLRISVSCTGGSTGPNSSSKELVLSQVGEASLKMWSKDWSSLSVLSVAVKLEQPDEEVEPEFLCPGSVTSEALGSLCKLFSGSAKHIRTRSKPQAAGLASAPDTARKVDTLIFRLHLQAQSLAEFLKEADCPRPHLEVNSKNTAEKAHALQ